MVDAFPNPTFLLSHAKFLANDHHPRVLSKAMGRESEGVDLVKRNASST